MVSKIISGGQTGADRAALDTAIELGIPHGGWVPRGRMAEDGPISDAYDLVEMALESYEARTEQNVVRSDGTLILSRGDLKGGSRYTRELAARQERPCLHVDLQEVNSFEAARRINQWIAVHDIRILNVAGPRASQDPGIYDLVRKVLKAACFMAFVKSGMPDPTDTNARPGNKLRGLSMPETVGEAVAQLMSQLTLRDKIMTAHMKEQELSSVERSLGAYIVDRCGLGGENRALIASCCRAARKRNLDPERASRVIIRALWKKLRESHLLRVVK